MHPEEDLHERYARWDTWAGGNCGHRYLAHQRQDAAGYEHGGCTDQEPHQGQRPVCLELLVPVPCVRHFHWTCSIVNKEEIRPFCIIILLTIGFFI